MTRKTAQVLSKDRTPTAKKVRRARRDRAPLKKKVSQLSAEEKDELLEILLIRAGLIEPS